MPDSRKADFHRGKSDSLLKAYHYLHLRTPEFIDPEIIALFYAMMHRVQEYIIRSGDAPPTNHRDRDDYVRLKMRKIHKAYKKLYCMGHRSRYRPEYATTAADERRAWAMCEEITAFLP